MTREPDHVPIHLGVQHPRPWLLPALHAEQLPARSYAKPARAEVGHPGDARKCPVPCHRQRVHDPDRPWGARVAARGRAVGHLECLQVDSQRSHQPVPPRASDHA